MSSMRSRLRRSTELAIGLVLLLGSATCLAECTPDRIKQLAAKGKTVAAIAKSCSMEKAAVRQAMTESSDDEDDKDDLLPKGAPVGQCGCWGPASPSQKVPHQMCESGYAKPRMCNAICPAGGYMWQGVCA